MELRPLVRHHGDQYRALHQLVLLVSDSMLLAQLALAHQVLVRLPFEASLQFVQD